MVQAHVLLVEDSEDDRALIEQSLRQVCDLGVRVVMDHAGTLEEALRRLATTAYDAVLLDLGLPDSDGLNTLQRTVAQSTTAVVVVSGSATLDLALTSVAMGAEDALHKNDLAADRLAHSLVCAILRRQGMHPSWDVSALAEVGRRVFESRRPSQA